MYKSLSSFSDLLNHYHKMSAYGVKTFSYFHVLYSNAFHFSSLPTTPSVHNFSLESCKSARLFMARSSFLLWVQVTKWQIPYLTPAALTEFQELKRNHLFQRWKLVKNTRALLTTACQANMQRLVTFFKPMFLFMCMHLHVSVTANEKKIGRTIWWIVSYMASISNSVIYGVNNGVYSQACSLVVFLAVARWQEYYS